MFKMDPESRDRGLWRGNEQGSPARPSPCPQSPCTLGRNCTVLLGARSPLCRVGTGGWETRCSSLLGPGARWGQPPSRGRMGTAGCSTSPTVVGTVSVHWVPAWGSPQALPTSPGRPQCPGAAAACTRAWGLRDLGCAPTLCAWPLQSPGSAHSPLHARLTQSSPLWFW